MRSLLRKLARGLLSGVANLLCGIAHILRRLRDGIVADTRAIFRSEKKHARYDQSNDQYQRDQPAATATGTRPFNDRGMRSASWLFDFYDAFFRHGIVSFVIIVPLLG